MCSHLSGWPVRPQNAVPLLTPMETCLAHRESNVHSAAALLLSCSPYSIPAHLSPPRHWDHKRTTWVLGTWRACGAARPGGRGRR